MRRAIRWVVLGGILVAGCEAAESADPAAVDGLSSLVGSIAEGSTDAMGLLKLANAANTTVTLLDKTCRLDSRAAKGIVAHRDGPDGKGGTADDNPFDTIAELDAVPYVGTAALDAMLTYARAHGFVTGDATTLGTYDGVLFTVDEGARTLALANEAAATFLDDDLGLDARAVKNIVGARPIASVAALAKLGYVGTSALKALKLAASAPGGADVAAHLVAASQGLYHTSESDYPFTLVHLTAPASTSLTTAGIKALLAPVYQDRPDEPTLAARDVEQTSLASFFDRYTVPQGWWEDEQKAQATQFGALRAVFETQLLDVHVFRLGTRRGNAIEGAVDVFLLGRSEDGQIVGLWTISVET